MNKRVVVQGDITTAVNVQAIVTLINPLGDWVGNVDKAIKRVAGDHYHNQAERSIYQDGQVLHAYRGDKNHTGSFNDVIFVIDALLKPLGNLIYYALTAAQRHGYTSVALPMMRTGKMSGKVEPTLRHVVAEIVRGIKLAEAQGITLDIYIVVYDDPETARLMDKYLHSDSPK